MSIILEALKKAERERATPDGRGENAPIAPLILREPGKGASIPLVAILSVVLVVASAAAVLFVAPLGKKWMAQRSSQQSKPAAGTQPTPTATTPPTTDPSLLKARALELFSKGDFAGSLPLWQELTAVLPGDFEAINNLGLVLKKLNRADEAVSAYERAIAANPSYAVARNNLGVLLMEQGKMEKAESHLKQASELDHGYANPHLHLAILLEKQKKKGEAAVHFREFLNLSPLLAPDLKEKITSRLARLNGEV